MKKAKLSIFKITIIILLAVLSYSLASPYFLNNTYAHTQGDLEINWGFGISSGDPIFTVLDFKPCDVEKRTVKVKNNDNDPKKIGVRGIKTLETGDISDVIDFVISTDGTDIYGGTTGAKTLNDFFDDSAGPGGITLATLNHDQSQYFTFTATFKCSAGNEYQQKKVVFDITLGVLTRNDCDEDEDRDNDDRDGDEDEDDNDDREEENNHHHQYRLIYEREEDYRNRDQDERCREDDQDNNHHDEHDNDDHHDEDKDKDD